MPPAHAAVVHAVFMHGRDAGIEEASRDFPHPVEAFLLHLIFAVTLLVAHHPDKLGPQSLHPGDGPLHLGEGEVEGVFGMRARVEGNDVGYGTIAAGGANACILHWTNNDAALRKQELLLLDAGVEGQSLYTADITRTVPMTGRFT